MKTPIRSAGRRGRLAAILLLAAGVAAHLAAGMPGLADTRADTRAANPVALPLGDGKWQTTGAQVGTVYSCTPVGGGGGASSPGPWIDQSAGTWNSLAKIAVQGSNPYTGVYSAKRVAKQQVRRLTGNGLPSRPAGTFPIQSTDPAYQYDRNPNTIAASAFRWSVPLNPSAAARPSCLPMGAIGVLNDGVALFNALDGEGRDAAAWEILDANGGHPERTGQYHHHDVPSWMAPSTGTAHSPLVGYAKDGFGIYGPLGNGGAVMSNAHLDVCHGHSHKVAWGGTQQRIYHYHATAEYPYTLGCFTGTPVK